MGNCRTVCFASDKALKDQANKNINIDDINQSKVDSQNQSHDQNENSKNQNNLKAISEKGHILKENTEVGPDDINLEIGQ